MSDPQIQPAEVAAPGLTQLQRVTNTFTAPSKTFQDIQQGHKSWWLPFLIMVLFGYLFFGAVASKVGWNQVAQNTINQNPKSQERMAQAPPEQRETTMKITMYSIEGGFAASPIIVLIVISLGSLVLMGTINFGFGGKATFSSIFAMWMYAGLPGLFKTILGAIVLFAGAAPESFNVNNFAPTNIGAFLNPSETNAAVYKLATAIDFTTLWSMVLLGMGLATVARVKRSAGYTAVFGWWALLTIISVGIAAITG